MKFNFLKSIALSLVLLLLLAACGAASGKGDLTGVTWKLVSYMNDQGQIVNAASSAEATMEFTSDHLSGNTGCNSYSAEYKLNGENITISQAISTLMACTSEAVMEQEAAFLRALSNAATFKVTGGTLELHDASGKLLVTFRAL